MRIPEHARNITISELHMSPSYLALRNSGGMYFLNGNWKVSWPGKSIMAGAMFDYKRPYDAPESVSSDGPINQALILEVNL